MAKSVFRSEGIVPQRRNSHERRSSSRLLVEFAIVIHCVKAGEPKAYVAKAREINELGISFYFPESVSLPEKIRIELESAGKSFKVPSRITWSASQNRLFGAAFDAPSEVIVSSLADFLVNLGEKIVPSVDRRAEDRRRDAAELWRELESHRSFARELRSKLRNRVVITGLGIVSPLGVNLSRVSEKLGAGRSGILAFGDLDFESPWPWLVLGQVKDFDAARYLGAKKARRVNRHGQLACAAAILAAENAGLKVSTSDSYRIGVYLGTSIAGMKDILKQHKTFLSHGIEKVQPFEWLGGSVGDSAAEISLLLKLRGPCHTVCTGSASSADAIGQAFRAVQSGDLDAVFVGGSEAPLFLEMLSLFHRTGVLAFDEDSPVEAMKPFDSRRNGFVLGEGAAFLVLENMDHAIKRNAVLHGEVIGYGTSCDSHHAFASDPLGRGMAWAVSAALRQADVAPSAIDYVNLHGTGTSVGDTSEVRALTRALGKDVKAPSMSSTKPFTGHLLGASGATEAIFTLLAMQDGFVPPTLNLKRQDPECALDFTALHSRKREIRIALSINSGFGGKNAAILFKSTGGSAY